MNRLFLKIFFSFIIVASFFPVKSYSQDSYPLGNFESLNLQQKFQVIDQEAKEGIEHAVLLIKDEKYDDAISILKQVNQFAPYQPQAYILQLRYYQSTFQEDKIYKLLEDAGKSIANFDIIFQALNFNKLTERKKAPQSTSLIRLATFKDDKETAISFNFDDGPRSIFLEALPILDTYGYKATINVNPIVVSDTYTNPSWGSWEEWKDAHKRGYEIGNHAYRHRKLVEVLPENWEHEINGSYDIIKDKIGVPPYSFVFPHDSFNEELIKKAQERHWAIRVHDLLTEVYPNIYIPVYGGEYFSLNTANQIIDLALKRQLWLVSECHAIYSDEIKTFKPITKEFLKEHLQYIKQHEDRIWVDTFINVYSYLLGKKNSELEFTQDSENSVTFKIKTSLSADKIQMPLTVVIDTSPNIPKNASVLQGDTAKKKLRYKIVNSKILIDVLPGSEPVKVSWSF